MPIDPDVQIITDELAARLDAVEQQTAFDANLFAVSQEVVAALASVSGADRTARIEELRTLIAGWPSNG